MIDKYMINVISRSLKYEPKSSLMFLELKILETGLSVTFILTRGK